MNKVNIVASLMNPIPLIHCDENKIKQVLINVFQNAIEAMPNGGTIHVSTELQENKVLIQVTDDGYGISNERIKKLGEPFYSNKEKGTGLGLMVCFKIMEEHGVGWSLKVRRVMEQRYVYFSPLALKNGVV